MKLLQEIIAALERCISLQWPAFACINSPEYTVKTMYQLQQDRKTHVYAALFSIISLSHWGASNMWCEMLALIK